MSNPSPYTSFRHIMNTPPPQVFQALKNLLGNPQRIYRSTVCIDCELAMRYPNTFRIANFDADHSQYTNS